MATEYAQNDTYEDDAYRRYEESYNLQIANAMISYGNTSMTSYDHVTSPSSPEVTSPTSKYSPPSPYSTSSEPCSPVMTSYNTSQNSYGSPSQLQYDSTLDDRHYHQTVIKDEPMSMYHPCTISMYPATMTSHTDDDCRLPAVVEDMKPDLNSNPTLFPPLSTEDVNQILCPPNLELYEHESELQEVRDICMNLSYPVYPGHRVAYHEENYDSPYYTDDGYGTETPPPTPGRVQSPEYVNPSLLPGRDGLFRQTYPSESSSDDSCSIDGRTETTRKNIRKVNRGQAKNAKLLWQFVVDLMVDPHCRHLADWVDRDDGVFRIIQSAEVAKLWGKEKGNPDMTYEKMSRALRYYYSRKILVRVDGRRLVYKFGPKSKGWRTCEMQMSNFKCKGRPE